MPSWSLLLTWLDYSVEDKYDIDNAKLYHLVALTCPTTLVIELSICKGKDLRFEYLFNRYPFFVYSF